VTASASTTEVAQQFHGLFIGINRYQSADISNLASAVRDASALHALFTDNLGGDSVLLADAEATTDKIRGHLRRLQSDSQPDDVVVICFSGHGSNSHELVSFDADVHNLIDTALPLSELTDMISAIPAKHLLVVLDCCFSGGAGAKVLNSPTLSRGGTGLPLSTEAFLKGMSGTGRVILTASTADQPAWEDARIGHGYLTYYVLSALCGLSGPAATGTIHLLDLLKYVTENVQASVSGANSALQEPSLRGQWDGEVIWPVFKPGPLYKAFLPEQAAEPVTSDIRSVAAHGLDDSILDAWSTMLPGLNQLQIDAINEGGLFEQRNMLVMAPTSSGKTMIGELAALRATQVGGRSVFLLPTKALVNEQYERFRRVYEPAGVRVLRATGDHNDDVAALLRGQFDMAVFTYEKFSGLVLAYAHLLRMISVVVVDEAQTVVDRSRGRELELLLTLIKSRQDDGIQPQIIALSAVLGDLHGLDSWLDAYVLSTTRRPVALEEGVLDMQGRFRYIDADGAEQTTQLMPAVYGDARARSLLIPLVRQLVSEGQQIIIIRGIRGEARGAAGYIAQSLGLPPAEEALAELTDGDLTQSSQLLRQSLAGGVAFHISDLSAEERQVVEQHFRQPDSKIRVVVATTTLAQGINMPAETVIMPELNRRVGRHEYAWYSVADYKNIAGRAGRLGLTARGRAIVLAYDQGTANTVWRDYVNGTPEDIHSTLLGDEVDLYTVVLRVAAIASARSDDGSVAVADMVGVLASSLAAHQARLNGGGEAFDPAAINGVVDELQRVQFLEVVASDRTRLTPLGELVAGSALRVASAVRVVDALRQVPAQQLNSQSLLAISQVTSELDATRLTVNARGIRPELNTFLNGLHQRNVAPAVVDALTYNVPDQIAVAARAKKAVACMLWVGGVPMSQIEQFVMQHYRDRNASGPVAAVVSRTHDIIETIISIAGLVNPTADLDESTRFLAIQLELGIPTSVAPFAIAGAGLRREDYLRLVQAGLTTADQVEQAEDEVLLQELRNNQAAVQSLRQAVATIKATPTVPSLNDLLGDPN
jgi:helicase